MNRRSFLCTASAAALPPAKFRAALIGHTGRGNYGHDWDAAFKGFPNVEVVAVADPDDAGRAKAKARSGAARDYRDYREMLEREKPNVVAICTRWLDQRVPMFTAVAAAGAHILLEKPFAATLEEADRMVDAAARARIKVQVGHTARPHPITLQVRRMVEEGVIGRLMEMRARGKEDRRAGGEDLIVLGSHCFDLMRLFAGDPQWVFANVAAAGRDVTPADARKPTEPVGPVFGDDVAAIFGFPGGVRGYFNSKASDVPNNGRFGITLYGSKGAIWIPLTSVPSDPASILRSTSWGDGAWTRIEPPPGASGDRHAANALMVSGLLEAIEQDHEPACSARDGRWPIEMVAGIYQSHFAGARLPFPLSRRRTV
ncbi:MAG: Gfo/Idh/MocA family protein [Bryobacteraceae bacterium]